MKTAAGSISTGDHLVIEINRGLTDLTKEPPRQLQTVPLTAKGLAEAQASAAALSKANSRESKTPPIAAKSATVSAAAVTGPRAVAPAPKSGSRGARLTMVAIGVLAIACVGAAWMQRSAQTVVSVAEGANATAEGAQAPATPPGAESAVGFVVAPRALTPTERAAAEAKAAPEAPAGTAPPTTAAPPATAATAPPAPPVLAATPAAVPAPIAETRGGGRPRAGAEPVAKPEPPAAARPKAAEKAGASVGEDKKPAPAPAAAPSTVDAILQQQLKSAIP